MRHAGTKRWFVQRATATGWIVLALLVSICALRLYDSAKQNAMTFDEPAYVAKGLALWRTGDLRPARLVDNPPDGA